MENNKNVSGGFSQKIEPVLNGIKDFFAKVGVFIRNHKIITAIAVAVVVLVAAVFGVVNHFLNKINIVQTPEQSLTQTTVVTLSTGERVSIVGLARNADGTFTLNDGRRFDIDGTVWNLDGSVVFYDGSYIRADGVVVLSDGTTIYTDSTVVFQDGSYIANTGITVDSQGYATFKSGKKAHITTFTIGKDGTIKPKESMLSSLKYSADSSWKITGTSEEPTPLSVEDDDAAIIEKSKDKLVVGDKSILQNANDKKIWYNDNIMNILLMGIDEGNKNYPQGRSDSMIVLSINKSTRKIKMISLSRAAYVAIKGYDNTRLNHAHGLGGAALAIDTIERNYKIRIDNYVSTNFDTFQQLIDTIDGVKIKLTAAEASALKGKIKANGLKYNGAGEYNLNGSLALEYVRLRKIDTDRARTQRQRNVLMAIVKKAKTMNVFQISAMLNRILPLITTDLSKTEIVAQARNLPAFLNGDIEQHVLPHKSSQLTLIDDFDVLLIDWPDEVKYTHELMYSGVTPSYIEK